MPLHVRRSCVTPGVFDSQFHANLNIGECLHVSDSWGSFQTSPVSVRDFTLRVFESSTRWVWGFRLVLSCLQLSPSRFQVLAHVCAPPIHPNGFPSSPGCLLGPALLASKTMFTDVLVVILEPIFSAV